MRKEVRNLIYIYISNYPVMQKNNPGNPKPRTLNASRVSGGLDLHLMNPSAKHPKVQKYYSILWCIIVYCGKL